MDLPQLHRMAAIFPPGTPESVVIAATIEIYKTDDEFYVGLIRKVTEKTALPIKEVRRIFRHLNWLKERMVRR